MNFLKSPNRLIIDMKEPLFCTVSFFFLEIISIIWVTLKCSKSSYLSYSFNFKNILSRSLFEFFCCFAVKGIKKTININKSIFVFIKDLSFPWFQFHFAYLNIINLWLKHILRSIEKICIRMFLYFIEKMGEICSTLCMYVRVRVFSSEKFEKICLKF
jgi:hypothetical protein